MKKYLGYILVGVLSITITSLFFVNKLQEKEIAYANELDERSRIYEEKTEYITNSYEDTLKKVLIAVQPDVSTEEQLLKLADRYLEEEKYEEAFMLYYNKLSENATAINNLGYMYQHGLFVNVDMQQAAKYYEKASKLGNNTAKKNWRYMNLQFPKNLECFLETLQLLEIYEHEKAEAFFEFYGVEGKDSTGVVADESKKTLTAEEFKLVGKQAQLDILEYLSSRKKYKKNECFLNGTYKVQAASDAIETKINVWPYTDDDNKTEYNLVKYMDVIGYVPYVYSEYTMMHFEAIEKIVNYQLSHEY